MTAVDSVPLSLSQPSLVKMEERKRPIPYDNDSAPPLKRQATAPNGASKPHVDSDMPWKDDLEVSFLLRPSPTFLQDTNADICY
jgi:E3 ubiquitin-protein ligase BRE1